jgi:hypothetical protein
MLNIALSINGSPALNLRTVRLSPANVPGRDALSIVPPMNWSALQTSLLSPSRALRPPRASTRGIDISPRGITGLSSIIKYSTLCARSPRCNYRTLEHFRVFVFIQGLDHRLASYGSLEERARTPLKGAILDSDFPFYRVFR